MAITARKDWLDRAIDQAFADSGIEGMRGLFAVLGAAPVKTEPHYLPLELADVDAATRAVVVHPLRCTEPGEDFDEDGHCAEYKTEHGNTGNNRAALRAELRGAVKAGKRGHLPASGPHEYGGLPHEGIGARVTVLLESGQTVVLQGSWAAIRRAVPDKETLKQWKAAGATEFPLYDFRNPGADPVWVPIDAVPKVVQMEYESRATSPMPTSKEAARRAFDNWSPEAEIAKARLALVPST